MVTYDNMVLYVEEHQRTNALNKENFWAYFLFNGDGFQCLNEPAPKQKDRVGYFVEDNTKLRTIYEVATKKLRRCNK